MFESKLTRRALVHAGLAAGILPLGSWAGAGNLPRPEIGGRPPKLHKLLVDRSIPESVRLGTYAASIADEVFLFDGDLTAFWNDELRSQWPKGPRPIGGLTAPGVRFVLEQLGRDHDARITFSAEHRKVAGSMRHCLVGSDALHQSAKLDGAADWVTEMAKLIVACPHQSTSRAKSVEYASRAGPVSSGHQNLLMTWILAPIAPLA